MQLDYAKNHGWGEWHGWHGDKWAGINRGAVPEGNSRTAEQHQALVEMAKKANPATLGNIGKAGNPVAAGAELPHMKGHDVDTAHVDSGLRDVLNRASQYLPKGYHAEVQSGFRRGDPRFHGRGLAEDIAIIGLDGKPVGGEKGNYQNPEQFRLYEGLAQNARKIQHDLHPELDKKLRWGGYFGGGKGKYGAMDTMHFDLGGDHLGMAGGSWEGGLTNKNFRGAKSAPMGPVSQYTPFTSVPENPLD